jgi:DNA modification methylase
LKTEKLKSLKLDAHNANVGTKRGRAMLKTSLQKYGAGRSILLDKKGRVIAGNKTVEAAGALGMQDVIVVETRGKQVVAVKRMDLDLAKDSEAKALAIADNRVSEVDLAWAPAVLADLGKDIKLGDFWNEDELNQVLGVQATTPLDASLDKAAELQRKWKTARGQLWEIDVHRLLCGDATKKTDVEALMDGAQANIVVTDPPYGVSYSEGVDGRKNQKKGGWAPIVADQARDDELSQFLASSFKLLTKHITDSAAFYIWHASRTRRDFEWAMTAAGLLEKQYLTWVKDSFVMGHSDYHYQTEPCFYAEKAGQHSTFHGDRTNSTAWYVNHRDGQGRQVASIGPGLRVSDGAAEIFIALRAPKHKKLRLVRIAPKENLLLSIDSKAGDLWQVSHETGDALHPTQKPSELAARALRNSSLPGEIVLDPFSGAGFTMVAAQMTDRKCYGLELEPKYVAVILERLSEMGLKPKKL